MKARIFPTGRTSLKIHSGGIGGTGDFKNVCTWRNIRYLSASGSNLYGYSASRRERTGRNKRDKAGIQQDCYCYSHQQRPTGERSASYTELTTFFQRQMTSVWRTYSHESMRLCPENDATDSGRVKSSWQHRVEGLHKSFSSI